MTNKIIKKNDSLLKCPYCQTEITNEKVKVCLACKRDISLHIMATRNPAIVLFFFSFMCLLIAGFPIFGWAVAWIFLPLSAIFLVLGIISFIIQLFSKLFNRK